MWQFLFGWRGRISRASFCLFAVIAFMLFLVLIVVLDFYEITGGDYERGAPAPWPSSPLTIAGTGVWFLALIFIYLAALAVTAKRLHDRNRSAWWLLVFLVAPNAISSFAEIAKVRHLAQADVAVAVLYSLALALFVWGFIELACLKGATGPNRFGEDPLKRVAQ